MPYWSKSSSVLIDITPLRVYHESTIDDMGQFIDHMKGQLAALELLDNDGGVAMFGFGVSSHLRWV